MNNIIPFPTIEQRAKRPCARQAPSVAAGEIVLFYGVFREKMELPKAKTARLKNTTKRIATKPKVRLPL
jgi:hypothetical protein